MLLTVAHSDDADDLAMFLALRQGQVASPRLRFTFREGDIATLNALCSAGGADLCAVSVAHLPAVAATYRLLPTGFSVGRGYGPVVVATGEGTEVKSVLTPGETTTAALVARRWCPAARQEERRGASLATLAAALRAGEADAAILVHEGRLLYDRHGLRLRCDLGAWWQQATGLPLPLGAVALRRSLPEDVAAEVEELVVASVRWSLDHRDQVLAALQPLALSRGLDQAGLGQYLDLYANGDTAAVDDGCRVAVERLLSGR